MEWVETTGKTIQEAQDRALDQLGVAKDEAEFEVVDQPKSGLFGLMRSEARVRARVRPEPVRPKQDRRRGRASEGRGRKGGSSESRSDESRSGRSTSKKKSKSENSSSRGAKSAADGAASTSESTATTADADNGANNNGGNNGNTSARTSDRRTRGGSTGTARGANSQSQQNEGSMESDVPVEEVGAAAVAFMDGLVDAFGLNASSDLSIEGTEIELDVNGEGLGLMIGPSGSTLAAIQDLARVSAQRRLGDHETRLRVDIAQYREKRKAALAEFTARVAQTVIDSGEPKALEPMSSSDRKVVHDTINDIEGVESRSDGDDPARRVVIVPAD